MSITNRIRKTGVILKILFPIYAILLLIFIVFWFYMIPQIEQQFVEQRKIAMHNELRMACRLLDEFSFEAESGKLSTVEAQEQAKNRLRSIKFGENGYFFIVDEHDIFIEHPYRETIENRPISSITSAGSNMQIITEGVKEARNGDIAYEIYDWFKPNSQETFQKISGFKYYPKWKWVVGTGDNIDNVLAFINNLENYLLLVVVVISVLITIILILQIRVVIQLPLRKLLKISQHLGSGNFENIDNKVMVKDEFGRLQHSMIEGITKVKTLIDELQKLNNNVIDGKLDYRARANNLDGAYKEIMGSANILVDNIVKPLNLTAEYIDRISKGDIPQRVTENYRGDYNEIKQNINQLLDTLDNFVAGMGNVYREQQLGNIDQLMNTQIFYGCFRHMAEGFNSVIELYTSKSAITQEILNHFANGDFNQKYERFPGKLAAINDAIEILRNNLKNVLEDFNKIIGFIREGKFDMRLDESKHKGDFARLIKSADQMIEFMCSPLEEVTLAVKYISMNKVDFKFNGEFPGKWEQLKSDLEKLILSRANFMNMFEEISRGDFNCIDSLRKASQQNKEDRIVPSILKMMEVVDNISEDINYFGNKIDDGELAFRIDSSKYGGHFKNVADAVNNTINTIMSPVNDASQTIDEFAHGKLYALMEGNYKGDNAKLKNSINLLGENFRDLVGNLYIMIDSVVQGSHQISSASDTLLLNFESQNSQITQVAASIEQMTRTISDNALSASHAVKSAQNNGEIAKDGSIIVSQTIDKMKQIADVVIDSASKIEQLGQSSKQISEIISVIDDIADQTNLLALNAAIEAARAGEQGRGFAVVADEVRKLAERTTSATKQISQMIKNIQIETERAVHSMNLGSREVSAGIEFADQAGKSLDDIVQSSAEVIIRINQIATATEEQSATSEQVAKVIELIADSLNHTFGNVREIAGSGQELDSLTASLQLIVQKFEIEDIESERHGAKKFLTPPRNKKLINEKNH